MKKAIILGVLIAFVFTLNSCSKDEDDAPFLGVKVFVTVKNIVGSPQKNTTVYLYKDQEITNQTKPSDAKNQAVTNDQGVAEFSLNLSELNILESQTSLYFGVFYTIGDQSVSAGSGGVTVKRGDSKNIDLQIPL